MIKPPATLLKPIALCAILIVLGCEADVTVTSDLAADQNCAVSLVVLGVGQDAGAPQIGNPDDPAWAEPSKKLWATSLALVDIRSGDRFLFEATPDIREQLNFLDAISPPKEGPLGLSGVFLTHAHIGHYAGLMFFGRESAGTNKLPVHAMPRMAEFLQENGPWEQLISLNNITLNTLENGKALSLPGGIEITPLQVPHRDEYSETVGYKISGPNRSALFLPDIDGWENWQALYGLNLQGVIASVDAAFLDATFFDDNELPGRDMRQIPHPRVPDTMNRLMALNADKRREMRFIHFNHTNPLRDVNSNASKAVKEKGFGVSQRGDEICL